MNNKIRRYVGSAIIVAMIPVSLALVWLVYQDVFLTRVASGTDFREEQISVANNNLVDLGVVDLDNDGNFDIFSVNHHSPQSLLLGDGQQKFVDVLSAVGLTPSLDFPGSANSVDAPIMDRPGLYIYWQNYVLVFHWIPGGGLEPPSGRISFESSVSVVESAGFDHVVTEESRQPRLPESTIEFSAKSQGKMAIESELLAVPVRIALSHETNLSYVYIGQRALHPNELNFKMLLNDRHGMAWADYDGDGQLDVFISRGGLRGQMGRSKNKFFDELFRQQELKFENMIGQSGIQKENCPGYNVQWVDVESDDDLDLYVSCHHLHKNKLYLNDGNGSFHNAAEELGLAFANRLTDTPFLWIDIDNNGFRDLLIADTDGVLVLANENGQFEHVALFPASGIAKLAANDYDNDGDIDILVASYSGDSGLLINSDSRFDFVPSENLGLPARILTAAWIDFDNDGSTDLHVLPGGIFKQTEKARFYSTGHLAHQFPKSIRRARSSWSDLDNDGDLDLLMAINYEPPVWQIAWRRIVRSLTRNADSSSPRNWQWNVRVFYNQTSKHRPLNDWVQFKLLGTQSNPQAIGANVILRTTTSSRAAFVGQFENSLMSQGHFRLYFGLGQFEDDLDLIVTWPDGRASRHAVESVNRLVRISIPPLAD